MAPEIFTDNYTCKVDIYRFSNLHILCDSFDIVVHNVFLSFSKNLSYDLQKELISRLKNVNIFIKNADKMQVFSSDLRTGLGK